MGQVCHELLGDSSFCYLLKGIDDEEARRVRGLGCRHCGGPLHAADYPRKAAGVGISEAFARRLSFCCAQCRKRTTPPSVRFLNGRCFAGVVVVLGAALRCGPTPKRIDLVAEQVGADRRTIERWCRWWRQTFGRCRFWIQARGKLDRPVATGELPAGVLDRFAGALVQRVVAFMRWLMPITGSAGRSALAF
jgi:hypothetical protein